MTTITAEERDRLLQDIVGRLDAMPKKTLTEAEVKALVDGSVKAYMDSQAPIRRLALFPGASLDGLAGSKFARWNMGVGDVEFLHDLMQAAQGGNFRGSQHPGPSEELKKAFKALSEARYLSEEEIKRLDGQALDGLYPRVTKAQVRAWEARLLAMDTAESGYGSQLVGAQYVSELWEAARMQSRIFALIPTFEMTAPTAYLPIMQAMPEMLYVSEATASDSANYATSKTGSNRVTVTAVKFVVHQMWSGEMEEDAIIPFLPFLRMELQNALAHYSDSVVLNGDTTNLGTGNINLDDADPADTKHYLAFDGLRHVGLVDNTNNRKDVAAALAADDLIDARGRMVDATNLFYWGAPTVPEDLVHVMDFGTYLGLVKLAGGEVVTVDKFGPKATILTGELAAIWGTPIIVSPAMSKTEADGKVSTTAGNNTKGQVCTFNRRGFVAGWRRRIKLEAERIPATDQNRIVASLRLGFGRYGASAGALEAADVCFNITV